jgi:hypothetical protein
LKTHEVFVDSPDGWVEVSAFVDKGEWDEYILECDDKIIRSNEAHLYETTLGWLSAMDILKMYEQHFHKISILTDSDRFVPLTHIENTGRKIPIVDIQVDHPNHRYYTNGISSHNTGVGKSLFMCHHAAASIKQGLNALYISLEMAEERIAERIDCNLLEVTLDELQRMKHTLFSDKIETLKASTHGKLKIKEFPTAGAHVGHFKSLLDDLKMKQNFVPDIIYIDYINICASQRLKNNGSANSYTIVKSIAEELRGFAVEYDVPILTATQVNRGGMNNTDVELTDTSESFGLPMTLDFMFALIRTEELDGMGQLMVKQLKSRFGDINYYKRFVIGIDLAHFRLFDSDRAAQENIHDAGRTEDDVPLFDKSKKWQAANIDGLDFS